MYSSHHSAFFTTYLVHVLIAYRESNDTTFYLCVNTRPVLTVGNNRLIFAPYNTFYSQIDVRILPVVCLLNKIDVVYIYKQHKLKQA